MSGKVSEKHLRFVQEYLQDLNAAQAAVRCGYAESNSRITGMRLKRRPEIAALIDAGMKARADDLGITANYVLTALKEALEKCRNPEKYDARGVFSGCELLGRHVGMFSTVKHEHTGKDGGPIETKNVSELSDEELLRIATGGGEGAADKKARKG